MPPAEMVDQQPFSRLRFIRRATWLYQARKRYLFKGHCMRLSSLAIPKWRMEPAVR